MGPRLLARQTAPPAMHYGRPALRIPGGTRFLALATFGTMASAGRIPAAFLPPLRVPTAAMPWLASGHALPPSRGRRAAPGGGMLHVRCLNRLILEPSEVRENKERGGGLLSVIEPTDWRAKHVKKIIKAELGDTLRIGVVDCGIEEDAEVEWLGDGSLCLHIPSNSSIMTPVQEKDRPRVDLLLALPRPPNVAEFLHTATQQGVRNIVLCNAAKVQADYFGSHVLREPDKAMREALKAGLSQCGETAMPRVHVAKRFKVFLEDQLEAISPDTVRLVATPQKEWSGRLPAIREVALSGDAPRIMVAVGPEAGWLDPYELNMLAEHGFQAVSLGERTLRTDVALSALLALAHDRIQEYDEKRGR